MMAYPRSFYSPKKNDNNKKFLNAVFFLNNNNSSSSNNCNNNNNKNFASQMRRSKRQPQKSAKFQLGLFMLCKQIEVTQTVLVWFKINKLYVYFYFQ